MLLSALSAAFPAATSATVSALDRVLTLASVGLASPMDNGDNPGSQLDNPAPQAPKGLEGIANQWIAWGKWGCLVVGVLGLLVCGGMMAVGRRNRSHLAGEGAAGIPWVIAGLSLAALAVPIASQVMNATSGG